MNKDNRLLWLFLSLLLIAVSTVALYKTWPILFPKVSISGQLDPDCDLRAGPCTTHLTDGGRVSFSIDPRDIPTMKPITLHVSVNGMVAQEIEVDFTGVDMNMGINRVTMNPESDGQYSGNGILPVCIRDAMEWEARVLISTRKGLVSVPYRFITVRPGVPLP
ncbi:MAG: hypothetical protein KZQ73_12690 [Candidatus Thiodiazotropha sp. (ex Semelilucina semeliformis)]|nr:hypothetical protein [Candidatus Thiodiazotropha sp. (ex Semelilucina semeliformis)]